MTGTGTQTDPFRPTNWDEFVTAIGQSGVHIECPENGVWDMNEMLPDGLRNGIGWLDNTVHGNGLTIKNLYFNGGFLNLSGAAETNIDKLNFLNMSTSGSNNYMFVTDSSQYNKNTFFRNCKFSGLVSSGIVFTCWQYKNQNIFLTHDGEKSCSLNFEFAGKGTLFNMDVYFRYCNIQLDGQTTANDSYNNYTAYEKCCISGKSPWQTLYMRGYDNIFDIEIPNGTTIANGSSGNDWKTNVLNSDKMHGNYTSNNDNKYLQATTEQLSDAAYLQSIGFSIAAG